MSEDAAGYDQAFLYSNGAMTGLGVTPGSFDSAAYGINDEGQIAGQSGTHAFLWASGVMTDLGVPPGFSNAQAVAINNSGQMAATRPVTTAHLPIQQRPFSTAVGRGRPWARSARIPTPAA